MSAVARGPNRIPTIAVACGAGARDPGCKDGPAAFRQYWDGNPASGDVRLAWQAMPEGLCAADVAPLDAVARTSRWLAETTCKQTENGRRPLVIGGDHSCAVGTWSGVARAMQSSGPLGLLWIDAHMDMHTPETTHSGAINGMPVAALLGYGSPKLTAIAGDRRALEPRHVCLVGTRSFEPEEMVFAKRHGIRVIQMDEVARRGIADVLAEAHAIVTKGTAGYGLSLDLDAFDPVEAPGVGTPAPDGIHAREFFDAWSGLTADPACRAIEFVEFNPHRDRDGKTARLLGTLVAAAVRQERLRWAV
ncbi:MAG: arginase [Xanthobacteraceae bacterium]|nr:arginase [Xanthobacteraceae bacterium]